MAVAEPTWVPSLRAQGMTVEWSTFGHAWVRFKRVAHLRYPTNDVAPMAPGELRALHWRHRMAVLQYHELAEADEANAVLYLCRDRSYGLDSLSSNNRSKVRRALKRLDVRLTTVDEILAAGYPSYLDTRQRHGSDAMTPEQFRENWERQRVVADREIWAAWAGAEIAAFGAVHRCGRWASISATVSHRAHQRDYPNHALFFTMLEHLMAQPEVESVSYGLSSLRSETSRDSLHRFKLSVGLEAVPVVRRVDVHPLVRPAVNRGTLALARVTSERAPTARVPRAARAALEFLLDEPGDPAVTSAESSRGDAASAAPPGESDEVSLLDAADRAGSRALARLHRRAFPSYDSSRLGERFCARLLRSYAARGDAWVAAIDGPAGPVGYLVAAPPHAQRAVNRSLRAFALVASVRTPHRALERARGRSDRSPSPGITPRPDPTSADEATPAARGEATIRVVLVGTDPLVRGQGIGARLLADFEQRAIARGHDLADLSVELGNDAARVAYERAGWTWVGDEAAVAARYQRTLGAALSPR